MNRIFSNIALLLCVFIAKTALGQVHFTENKGQWDEKIIYKADMRGAKLFVAKGELDYLFYSAQQIYEFQHKQQFDEPVKVHAIKVEFLGANPDADYSALNPYDDYSNYFHGTDTKRWKSHVRSYNKVYITNIYPKIDFELFESLGGLKYNFIVKPGGDPAQIKLRYIGADSLRLDNGNLIISNSFGTVMEERPLVFQGSGSAQTLVPSSYQLKDNILSFVITGKRSKNKDLLIDPKLVFSTYSGSKADNFGYTATFDTAGNGYAGGTVFGFDFPTSTGAFMMSFAGGEEEDPGIGYIDRDCGITKYSKDGKQLLFSTYLGGSLSNENPHSMIVDSRNNLLVMGSTKSRNFPVGLNGSFDATFNGLSDIFVVKFSEDGTALLGGTFVGGSSYDGLNGDRPSGTTSPLLYNYADDFRGEIIVDENNDVFVATTTNSFDFPTKNGFDNSHGGEQDACIFKLSSDLKTMLFSSFFGGVGDDAAYGLDFGTHNDLYFTGGTNSASFIYPSSVSGMTKNNAGGRSDGYIVRLTFPSSSNAPTLSALSFIGTSLYDQSYFVKTDKYGKPFVFGQTQGNMGVSNGVHSNKNSKMFIKKFAVDCSSIELETTFGGVNKKLPDISPTAFLVDECERIFVSGWGDVDGTTSINRTSGTIDMETSTDGYKRDTDGKDFYIAVFSKNLTELQYGTFFGGNGYVSEHVDGGTCRFDKKGIVYHSVCAGCGGESFFPTSDGAWSRTNNSHNCNNALFKFDFENLNRKPLAKDSIYEVFATDYLDFNIDVSDPDISDSLRVVLTGEIFADPNFPKPLPKIQSLTKLSDGKNTIRANITWTPGCKHAGMDTIKLKVKVYDQGCPTQDSNQAIIKIVVKDPPLTITPETFCMLFNEDASVKLSWKAFEKNKFFSHVVLYRIHPNGGIKALDTIRKNDAGEYLDRLPQDPRSVNFTYYMVGFNICNKAYDKGLRVNTLKEFNVPIDSTYLHYATVVDNKNVQVNWFTSKEEDFGSYEVFRADNINGISSGYRKIKTITQLEDTSFTDQNVNVAERSYCYKIGVNDKCGHVSKPSNEACNVVLKGKAGHLYFDLDWLPYRQWVGGVQDYELYRRVDTGSLRSLVNTSLLRVHHDEDLDLWWGAYFYVVKAYEGTVHGIGYKATSLSNEIRLIQPPMVFVPNAFSPNGDNVNDVWGVSHAFVKDFNMRVFNRWGEKVWENDFKGSQWDGTTRGRLAMNDVFVWVVTYKGWDNKFYTQKGTVTVMP